MKNKNPVYKKWWFWVVIILIVILIIFFFPKNCGGSGGTGGSVTSINCNCIGFVGHNSIWDYTKTLCYGICLKNSCKTTTSLPEEKNETKSNDSVITLPVSPTGNFKLTIKASNPQYKFGQDISISYTIENTDNKTITIPKDVSNGIEIKDSAGKIIEYAGSEPGIVLIKESAILNLSGKMNSNFVIQGSDYDLLQGGSSDGSYPVVTAFVGEVRSNRVILRIVK